jgi:thiol-disulfide isomerase/thioredoxin
MVDMESWKTKLPVFDNHIRILFFSSPSCQKCHLIEPKIDALVQNNAFNLIKIDTTKDIEAALKYNVLSLPTLIFLRGDKEEKRLTSTEVTPNAIEKFLKD